MTFPPSAPRRQIERFCELDRCHALRNDVAPLREHRAYRYWPAKAT